MQQYDQNPLVWQVPPSTPWLADGAPHLGHFLCLLLLFWVDLIRLSYFAELYVHMLSSVFLLCESRRVSPLLISLIACIASGYTVGMQNNFGAYTNA